MTNPDHTLKAVPVNGTRLRAARLRAGLGTRDLARDAGTNIMVVNLMEKENRVGSQMSLADARRIAEAAGLNLTDLLTTPPTPDPDRPDPEPTAATDVPALVQLLAADTRHHERDDLAAALGWTIPRVEAAIDAAIEPLAALGLTIIRANTSRVLRPTDSTAHDAYEKLIHRRASLRGFNLGAARILRDTLLHDGQSREPTDADKPSIGFLVNIGILRPGHTGEPFHVVTDAARHAFDIPDPKEDTT